MGGPLRYRGVHRAQRVRHDQGGKALRQSTLFVWIAAALGLVAALAALVDRDTLSAVAWFGFAAAGAFPPPHKLRQPAHLRLTYAECRG